MVRHMTSNHSDRQAGVGHNSGMAEAHAESLSERRARFQAEITRFVARVRCETPLEPSEIVQFEGMSKLLALRDATLVNSIRWCRQNRLADATVPVMLVITAMADLGGGVCMIGAQRLAQILGRRVENIHRALARLEKCDCIRAIRQPGGANAWYPVIDRHIAAIERTSPAWAVDAFSAPPARPGRPRATSAIVTKGKNPADAGVMVLPEARENAMTHASKPTDAGVIQILLVESADEEEDKCTRITHSIRQFIEQDWIEEFHELNAYWSGLGIRNKQQSAEQLRSELKRHQGLGNDCLAAAVLGALAACRAARDRKRTDGNQPIGSMAGYFRKALLTEIARNQTQQRVAEAESATLAEVARMRLSAEEAALQAKHKALEATIARNADRRAREAGDARGTAGSALIREGRFRDEAIVERIGHLCVTGFHCNKALAMVPGSDPACIRDALLQISKTVQTDKRLAIGDVTDKLVQIVRRNVAYRTVGEPEKLMGGPCGIVPYSSQPLVCGHYGLSQVFCDNLAIKYPLAWSQQATINTNLRGLLTRAVDNHATGLDGLGNYGPDTQAAIECEVERKFLDIQKRLEQEAQEREDSEQRIAALSVHFAERDIRRFDLQLSEEELSSFRLLPVSEQKLRVEQWLTTQPASSLRKRSSPFSSF